MDTTPPSEKAELRDEMYGRNGYKVKDKMICSEFVAKSTIAALVETNELLVKQLQEQKVISASEQVMKLPLKTENLNRIHPQRLINLLEKEGCLEKVSQPAIFSALIDSTKLNTHINQKTKKQQPEEQLYRKLAKLAEQHEEASSFIPKAIKAFRTYANHERLEVNFKDQAIQHYLSDSLKTYHSEVRKAEPSAYFDKFKSWFQNLGKKLGITNDKARVTIETAINKLEKINYESIKHKYQVNEGIR